MLVKTLNVLRSFAKQYVTEGDRDCFGKGMSDYWG